RVLVCKTCELRIQSHQLGNSWRFLPIQNELSVLVGEVSGISAAASLHCCPKQRVVRAPMSYGPPDESRSFRKWIGSARKQRRSLALFFVRLLLSGIAQQQIWISQPHVRKNRPRILRSRWNRLLYGNRDINFLWQVIRSV